MLKRALGFRKKDKPAADTRGFKIALKLFQEASRRVPAYKEFLRKNNIDPSKILTEADFRLVPAVTKDNYLKAYPLEDLLWDGDTRHAHIVSTSSGSSGKPTIWFRGEKSTQDSIVLHDRILDDCFATKDKKTLFIIAFAMGTWIAGTYTLQALQQLSKDGHNIVTITPGINKQEVVYILKNLAPLFEQVILSGYPPFVKDILDEAANERAQLSKLNLKILFAGENFSERWRDYILDRLGKPDPLYTTVTIYGTADAGLLGNETPLSVYARRLSVQHHDLFHHLFPGTNTLPSLVQYDPELRYFETDEEDLVFTVDNAMPLIRYKILDQGHLIDGESLVEIIKKHKHPIPKDLLRFAHLPYIALYGRTDICTTFYALDIYPENIKYGLEKNELHKYISGKFVLKTENEEQTQQQVLHLYVELKKDVVPQKKISTLILDAVLESLRLYNSEYNRLYQEIGTLADPVIHLIDYNDPQFEIKIKHRWT